MAVYSEADADALHVRQADEAVLIGPPPSAQSYLQIDKIVAACKKTGAQAVHPGYGFLSEKQEFQKALAKAGIAFIGPDALRHPRHGRQDRSPRSSRRRPASAPCRAICTPSPMPRRR